MIRSMSYSRYFRIATPMPTGSAGTPTMAAFPIADTIGLALSDRLRARNPQVTLTAVPASAHFTC
jgi:hypothetical protein